MLRHGETSRLGSHHLVRLSIAIGQALAGQDCPLPKALLLPEFKYEAFLTRRLLTLVPAAQASWKPHAKSMELQELAQHLATIPTWVNRITTSDRLNLATSDETSYLTTDELAASNGAAPPPADLTSTADLLARFDANTAQAMEAPKVTTNEDLLQVWTMREGEKVLFFLLRVVAIRNPA